jgi:putative membrane protein
MRNSGNSHRRHHRLALAALAAGAFLALTAPAPRLLAQTGAGTAAQPAPPPQPAQPAQPMMQPWQPSQPTAPATASPGQGTTAQPPAGQPTIPGDLSTGDHTPTLAPQPVAVPAAPSTAVAASPDEAGTGGTSLVDTTTFGGNAISHADRRFARAAVFANIRAEELGKLAAFKSTNADVKAFGKSLAEDGAKIHIQLLVAGNAAGVTLPGEMNAPNQKAYAELAALSGNDFDRAFVDAVVTHHTADLQVFEHEAHRRCTEVNLNKFAAATVPVLQQQLNAAKDLQAKLGGAPGATTPAAAPPGATGSKR